MRRKIICFCFALIILLEILSFSVCAYNPSTFLVVNIHKNDIPKDTAYIDLLIPIRADDNEFVYQKDDIENVIRVSDASIVKIENTSEIARYDQAYYSYLFHYKDSTISIYFDEYSRNIVIHYGENQKLIDSLVKMETCKFAFVDAEGNILKLSDEFSIRTAFFKDFSKLIITETEVSTIYTVNSYRIGFAFIAAPVLIVLSIVIALYVRRKGNSNRSTADGTVCSASNQQIDKK